MMISQSLKTLALLERLEYCQYEPGSEGESYYVCPECGNGRSQGHSGDYCTLAERISHYKAEISKWNTEEAERLEKAIEQKESP